MGMLLGGHFPFQPINLRFVSQKKKSANHVNAHIIIVHYEFFGYKPNIDKVADKCYMITI